MTRLLSFAGTCVLLFSCLAIGIGTAPAQATTIYDFTATNVPGILPVASDFTLQYDDLNGNGRFGFNELVVGSFSGVNFPIFGFYTTLMAVPMHNDTSSPLTEGGIDNQWHFSIPGTGEIGPPSDKWTYSQTAVVVPLPPTALLMGSGLLGLVGLRRFKKS